MSRTETSTVAGAGGNEQGVALISVMLASLIVGGLILVMFMTASFETRATGQARDYEAAIHTAEAGVEAVFGKVLQGEDVPEVVWTGPTPGTDLDGERAEVLRLIDELGEDVVVVESGVGTGYGIGPFDFDGNQYVYGVGTYRGGDGTVGHRFILTTLQDIEATPPAGDPGGGPVVFGDYGMLMGGNLTFSDNPTQMTGAVHANGNITTKHPLGIAMAATPPSSARPLSATGSIDCTPRWCPRLTPGQLASQPPIPMYPNSAPVDIPELRARDVHRRYAHEAPNWVDLCAPDGSPERVYPSVYRPTPGVVGQEPCTGTQIARITGSWPNRTYHGWQYNATSRTFTKTSGDGGYPPNGVYYAHQRNIQTGDLWNSSARITLIASADAADSNTNLGARSGNIVWKGNSHNLYYEGLEDFELALFADRDIEGDTGTGRAEGVVYAREQVRMTGNAQVWGRIVAAGNPIGPVADGAKSSPESPLDEDGGTWRGTIRVDVKDYSFEVDPGEDAGPPVGGGGPPEKISVKNWSER